MRRFDACGLCLNRAREPLACSKGHLFCKECIYTDLRAFILSSWFLTSFSLGLSSAQITVTQKKDIKRQKDRLEALKKEVEEERTLARQAARERVLRDFERGQLRLGNSSDSIIETADSKASEGRGNERRYMFLHAQSV